MEVIKKIKKSGFQIKTRFKKALNSLKSKFKTRALAVIGQIRENLRKVLILFCRKLVKTVIFFGLIFWLGSCLKASPRATRFICDSKYFITLSLALKRLFKPKNSWMRLQDRLEYVIYQAQSPFFKKEHPLTLTPIVVPPSFREKFKQNFIEIFWTKGLSQPKRLAGNLVNGILGCVAIGVIIDFIYETYFEDNRQIPPTAAEQSALFLKMVLNIRGD